jgi:hypothetical protein
MRSDEVGRASDEARCSREPRGHAAGIADTDAPSKVTASASAARRTAGSREPRGHAAAIADTDTRSMKVTASASAARRTAGFARAGAAGFVATALPTAELAVASYAVTETTRVLGTSVVRISP